MKRTLAIALLLAGAAHAGPLRSLDDRELEQVNARDGISFAAHVAINDPTLVGATMGKPATWCCAMCAG
jgi:hypothetical protein